MIDEAETEYQYARVVEYPGGARTLELNEGQAVHSIYDPDTVVTGTSGTAAWCCPSPRSIARRRRSRSSETPPAPPRARTRSSFPRTRIDAVEIDPELSEIGRRLFDMNNPRMTVHHEDARPFIRRTDSTYDVITVDAYRQPYIPFYLTTEEFFESVRQKLAPDGVLIVNAAHPEGQDELEQILSATIGRVFRHVLRDPMMPSNTLLVASSSPLSADHLREQIPALPAGLRAVAREQVGPPRQAARGRRGLHR